LLRNWKVEDGIYYVVIFNEDAVNILKVSYDIDQIPLCQHAHNEEQQSGTDKHVWIIVPSVVGGVFVLVIVGFLIKKKRNVPASLKPLLVNENDTGKFNGNVLDKADTIPDDDEFHSKDLMSEVQSIRKYRVEPNLPGHLFQI
jgi:hypothetical protein